MHEWGRVFVTNDRILCPAALGVDEDEAYVRGFGHGTSRTGSLTAATEMFVLKGGDARTLVGHEFDAAATAEWVEAGFTSHDAADWARFGFSPADASAWRGVRVRLPETVYCLQFAGCNIEMYPVLKAAVHSRGSQDKSVKPSHVRKVCAFIDAANARGVEVAAAEAAAWASNWRNGTWETAAALDLVAVGVTFQQAEGVVAQGVSDVKSILMVVVDGIPAEWVKAHIDSQAG